MTRIEIQAWVEIKDRSLTKTQQEYAKKEYGWKRKNVLISEIFSFVEDEDEDGSPLTELYLYTSEDPILIKEEFEEFSTRLEYMSSIEVEFVPEEEEEESPILEENPPNAID